MATLIQVCALDDDPVVANARTELGPHLVRDLAKAIHCKISLETGPDAGSRFVLSF